MADSIIYLVVGSCYFADDPQKVHFKDWHLDAFRKEAVAWSKVDDLRKKEEIRVMNLVESDFDFNIRYSYSVNSILLFGKKL